MKVKEESEKAGLKLNIQQTKTMASGTTLSWQIEVGKVEAMTDFVLLAPKLLWTVTVAMKSRHLLIGRKTMTKPRECIKKTEISLCQQRST